MSDQMLVEFDVPAIMRDGTVLRANVFHPAAEGHYPVALARTPYGKDASTTRPFLNIERFVRAGYIVVVQDTRGRGTSEGEWKPFLYEGQDGYDTVGWAAGLAGSNGNVGMFGASYVGFTQWITAVQAPPQLKAIMPSVTWANAEEDGFVMRGGALELGLMAQWHLEATGLEVFLRRYREAQPASHLKAWGELVAAFDRLADPVYQGYQSLLLTNFQLFREFGLLGEMFDYVLTHHAAPEYCSPFSKADDYARVTIPAFNLGGWYDVFTNGTLRNFTALRTSGATPEARQARLVIGPWTHGNFTHVVGEQEFGLGSALDLLDLQTDMTGLTLRWFDRWLKGIDNGITEEPPVKLFIMGENVWRDEQEWPLARTVYTPYYLHDLGRLSTESPGDELPDHYTYDPTHPTPTVGGAVQMNLLYCAGVIDQRPFERREDVLVFTSNPLPVDTEVTGPVLVKLWAASDAADTDFVARLVDLHPDGFARNLADGIIRASYRAGKVPQFLEPGQPYQFSIDLWATANLFKRGHRIQLQVASACFPRWDRHTNTVRPFGIGPYLPPAHQTIFHDAAHPSQVVLPVIPRQVL